MSPQRPEDVEKIFREGTEVEQAIMAARRRIILEHRRLGVPLVIWRDGKVVEVSPDSVDLPPDRNDARTARRGRS